MANINANVIGDEFDKLVNSILRSIKPDLYAEEGVAISQEEAASASMMDMDIKVHPIMMSFLLRNLLRKLNHNGYKPLTDKESNEVIVQSSQAYHAFGNAKKGIHHGTGIQGIH